MSASSPGISSSRTVDDTTICPGSAIAVSRVARPAPPL
jgi:hypothetical protein